MEITTKYRKGWISLTAAVLALGSALSVNGQTVYPGDTAIFNSTGVTNSHSFIDASALSTTGTDICSKINAALLNLANSTRYPLYNDGGVIDARGVAVGTSRPCSSSPWSGTPPSTGWPSATILLPAGVIAITTGWALPSGTRLIGEGAGTSGASLTTIQAQSGFVSSNWMIQMGSTSFCPLPSICYGVSIQDLTLDGNSVAANGILNNDAASFSYVNRVNLYRLSGTGLQVSGNASYSGPYSEINFDTGSIAPGLSTLCASIQRPTKGVHGLRCVSTSSVPVAAVKLDAGNNSLEDINVEGFGDGVLVGSNSSAQGDVLVNVSKSGAGNVVHLAKITGNTVSDISIVAASNSGNATFTIEDDVTGTSISDASVAIYVLGESQPIGSSFTSHTRFTTSSSQPAWGVGPSSPMGSCMNNGAIFSCTGPTTCGVHYLYVCKNGSWVGL